MRLMVFGKALLKLQKNTIIKNVQSLQHLWMNFIVVRIIEAELRFY